MLYIVIAKEKFKSVNRIQNRISKSEWIDIIDKGTHFTWYEDTGSGKEYYSNFPDSSPKVQALTEYDEKGKYFNVVAYFSEEYGIISFDMPRMTKVRLLILYNLATQLNALLLKNGSKEIDLEFISALK
ncbi:hypothetical protein [Haliscomenobacter sp.]|uniref:hypothetical protein n=1 Tax=Haliscomenobacter sp. TaxID=2717303 RepID=UPI0035947AA8